MLVRIILFMFMVSLLPKIGKVLFNRLTGKSATWSCSMGNDMKSTNPDSQSSKEERRRKSKRMYNVHFRQQTVFLRVMTS